MDFSFIEPAFKTAFGNVSVAHTAEAHIFKSLVGEDSYFTLELSVRFDRLERTYETKDKLFRKKYFFDEKLIRVGTPDQSLCVTILMIVLNLSTVSEWGFSLTKEFPIDWVKFVVEEFGRLENKYGRKNYLIIAGDGITSHIPEGCGLALQLIPNGKGIDAKVTDTGSNMKSGGGNIPYLFNIIGWWFHNNGESLEEWVEAFANLPKIYGIDDQTPLEKTTKPQNETVDHKERFQKICQLIVGSVFSGVKLYPSTSTDLDYLERKIMSETTSFKIFKDRYNEQVLSLLKSVGYSIHTVGTNQTLISW
jgi:hypothetical protein